MLLPQVTNDHENITNIYNIYITNNYKYYSDKADVAFRPTGDKPFIMKSHKEKVIIPNKLMQHFTILSQFVEIMSQLVIPLFLDTYTDCNNNDELKETNEP